MLVEHLSMITTPVILLKGDEAISQGTGFYYILDSTVLFLVTNYHVLTGHPPEKAKPPKGDNIIFYLHKDAERPGDIKQIKFPLFTKDSKPIWLGSKELPHADVAVIPIVPSLTRDAKVFGVSEDWTGGDIKVRPTSTITLIGYPYGYYDKQIGFRFGKLEVLQANLESTLKGIPSFWLTFLRFLACLVLQHSRLLMVLMKRLKALQR